MDEFEQAIATRIYGAIQDFSRNTPRGLQAQEYRVGVSDLGWCSEKVRRMIVGIPEADPQDLLAAFIGTAIGADVERAIKMAYPDAITQAEVELTLHGDLRDYTITGHPDVVIPSLNLVIDGKTDYGLSTVERTGPTVQQEFQRHMYGQGAWEAGLLDCDLPDVKVGNVWIDRTAGDHYAHVQARPFAPSVVAEATQWLDEVVYAVLHDATARKEPPRNMCAVTCGHFSTCRVVDTDVTGLITDPVVETAAAMYREGLDLEKEGKRLKDQSKAHLTGISGRTREHSIRSIQIEGGDVAYTRRPSIRLEVREL